MKPADVMALEPDSGLSRFTTSNRRQIIPCDPHGRRGAPRHRRTRSPQRRQHVLLVGGEEPLLVRADLLDVDLVVRRRRRTAAAAATCASTSGPQVTASAIISFGHQRRRLLEVLRRRQHLGELAGQRLVAPEPVRRRRRRVGVVGPSRPWCRPARACRRRRRRGSCSTRSASGIVVHVAVADAAGQLARPSGRSRDEDRGGLLGQRVDARVLAPRSTSPWWLTSPARSAAG